MHNKKKSVKRFSVTSILLASAISLLANPAHSGKDYLGANYTTYSGFSIDAKMVSPAQESHPSLWFDEERLKQFKKSVTSDSRLSDLWSAVKHHRYTRMDLPQPVSPSDGTVAVHRYYGDMTQIALYNAFMVWMSEGNDREFYLSRAVTALSRTYDGPIYDLDPTKSGIDKSVDEIYRGVWNQSLAAAYDFLQPFLTPTDDKIIRERLIKEAIYTNENLHTWAKGPHNHLSKPAWGLASLALALSNEKDAKNWFKTAITHANKNTRYHFSADGIYREGAQYYLFSWLNYVPFLYHYKNVSDVDLFETFQSSMEWSIKARNGRGWMMNLEDSFIRPIPTQMVAAPYMNYRSELNPEVPFGELLQWAQQTTDFEPFDKAEQTSTFNYTGASWDYPKELYELITYQPDISASAPTAQATQFMQGGQTVFRNQWNDGDQKQQYLLFHGVPHADNHDHHDQLSYVLYANGQMMASDQGYTRKSYGEDIRYSWYRTAEAHNTLTMNDIPLGDFIENKPAPSSDRVSTEFIHFEKKSAPFKLYLGKEKGSANRSIAYIEDDYFLVLDDVKAAKESKFSMRYHGGRSSVRSLGDQLFWLYKDDEYGPKTTLLTQEFSHGAKKKFLSGEGTYIKGDYTEVPFIELTKEAKETRFAQLLFPITDRTGIPEVDDLSNSTRLAARISSAKGIDLFVKQTARDMQKLGEIKTDAQFAWSRTKTEENLKIFAQSATQFDWNGEKLLRLSSPATVAINMQQEKISGGFFTSEQTTISIAHLGRSVKAVKVNNVLVKHKQLDNEVQFSLSGEGSFTIDLQRRQP